MKTGDDFKTDTVALLAHMYGDTRFSADERTGLLALHTLLTAGGDSTREQDMHFVNCLKKFTQQDGNY